MNKQHTGIHGRGHMNKYTPVIGMEIHVELKTVSKMFCGCKNDPFHAPKPNIYTCPVCLGMPGGIPVPNKKAIEWTILLGHAVGCSISSFSKFDRKHYFYPDLAKGYQISQYDQPFCRNGVIETSFGIVHIHRIHLEEDTGKLQHTTLNGKKVTLVDFNRCGVPLVEIVTEPDITSAQQAKEYAQEIRGIVKALDISNADMEKGSMRLEANISLTQDPGNLPDYKVEVKNINSFRFLEQAILYELKRQEELLEKGITPKQETRGWNEEKGETVAQRSKEDAQDYRYFPDPDIPPIHFTEEEIEHIRTKLPALPKQKQETLRSLGIKEQYIQTLMGTAYEKLDTLLLVQKAKEASLDPNSVIGAVINAKIQSSLDDVDSIISAVQAHHTFDEVSKDELNTAVQEVVSQQVRAVSDYKAGKTQVIGFLLGMVMKKLQKKIDPKIVQSALVTKLQ